MRRLLAALLVSAVSICSQAKTNGVVRLSLLASDAPPSFQRHGTGLQRFNDDTVALSQALVSYSSDVYHDWRLHAVVNGYSDGERKAGISQLYAEYRPLSAAQWKPSVKVGAFYPALSVENTTTGWLSPHFLSNSAINSWIGEEVRTGGAEFSLRRPGRQARSLYSWSLHGGMFKGNDTTATLISWRGFALHDRQSLYNDRIHFPRWPGVVSQEAIGAPAWTEPFHEIDGRWGWYAGAHMLYRRTVDLRYYYYDNRANPTAITPERLYGWHTRFHSLSFRQFISSQWQWYAQVLTGSTLMGEEVVNNDFHAAYAALSYLTGKHRVSARADWFQVVDNDDFQSDRNASAGYGVTANYQYQVSSAVSLSGELQYVESGADNRVLINQARTHSETLLQLAVTFTF
ncbi:hypothetical protein [Alteromonas sp. CYL-A6]|uniref:hypothetical protein n=1 Tax=Alteromonas nitratireducens TaxID=3390813 RepID=UPI0034BF2A7E